ncbi:MAG: hypothetical protein ABTD50_18250 [Polyangiaceae bacterium]|jgi:hypothetical protein
MAEKALAVARLASALDEGGVLFGSTILGKHARRNAFARILLRVYNRKGIFSNLEDSEEGLRGALEKSFTDVRTERVGTVALFEARGPRRGAKNLPLPKDTNIHGNVIDATRM